MYERDPDMQIMIGGGGVEDQRNLTRTNHGGTLATSVELTIEEQKR